MASRQIIITDVDRDRLHELLSSEFVQAIGPVEYLDDLKAEVGRAEIVPPTKVPSNVVTMHSSVALRDQRSREIETYTLVFPEEADIAKGRLSVLAPVGTAILGQRVGDELKWRVPEGWRAFRIERVLHQPEREENFDRDADYSPNTSATKTRGSSCALT